MTHPQPRVLILSFSDLGSDPRVQRQIDALRDQYELVTAGLAAPSGDVRFVEVPLTPRTPVNRIRARVDLLLRRYRSAYWSHPAYTGAVERLHAVEPSVTIANDVAALPIALRLGAPVVFDAHEYAPAQSSDERAWNLLMAPYVRWLCRTYMPKAAAAMTVSDMIAEAYARDTGVRPVVVTNAPAASDLAPSPPGNPIRVIHHGAAIRSRGLEGMIEVANLLDERFAVDFALVESGPGYRAELERLASGNPRVRFVAPFASQTIVESLNAYDIGLYLLAPRNFNQLAALPNKLFEFVQARLAVAIGPSPEMARVVDAHGCGVVAADFRPETLAARLNDLDVAEIARLKEASDAASPELSGEANAVRIRELVERALAGP